MEALLVSGKNPSMSIQVFFEKLVSFNVLHFGSFFWFGKGAKKQLQVTSLFG